MKKNDRNFVETTFVEKDAENIIKHNSKEAKEILANTDKMERFIQRMEKKMKIIPKVGDKLSLIPALFSLIKSYYNKEYLDPPVGTIIAVIAALLYFLAPIDVIPDIVPAIGYIDDGIVITVCLKLVGSDVKEYLEWRESNGKNLF